MVSPRADQMINGAAGISPAFAAVGKNRNLNIMRSTLLRFRGGIGQMLGLIACTATIVYLQYLFEWTWYISIPIGVLAFVSTLVLWSRFTKYLEESVSGP